MSDFITAVAQDLAGRVGAALEAEGRPVTMAFVPPGNTVAWDSCGCEDEGRPSGMAWVRVVSAVAPGGSQGCDLSTLQVRLGVGAVRYMHGVSDERFPTAEEMTSDAEGAQADAATLLGVFRCARDLPGVNPKSMRVEQGLPLGPSGYCGGFEWTVTLHVVVPGAGGCR